MSDVFVTGVSTPPSCACVGFSLGFRVLCVCRVYFLGFSIVRCILDKGLDARVRSGFSSGFRLGFGRLV